MGMLINIDNGGTLTDVCVIDGDRVFHTKTITTPYDLSKCFMEGLKRASVSVLGREDIGSLLSSTDFIRYSTTQGTNALVERKGPRLGLITDSPSAIQGLQRSEAACDVFRSLVGERVAVVATSLEGEDFTKAVVDAVNAVTAAGAHRIVVSFAGRDGRGNEARFNREATRMFPRHMLGAVPILYAGAITGDSDTPRRTWTALYNAFLHPAMERFLYHAEGLLRPHRMRKPLLIYGNGGLSGKVVKTTALRTYSSGPRAGMEGVRAIADYYGLNRVLSFDVGGTTTDIGLVAGDKIRSRARGQVEGVDCSFSLSDIVSVGVGGGSIFRCQDGLITVGPDSVGGAPGPACFGLGGQQPTITDALLLMGLFDPATYFGGAMALDVDRARTVVQERIADPLGITVPHAVHQMLLAWARKIGVELKRYADVTTDTTLLAFGGGGPLAALTVADAIGAKQVLVPRLAAVFSAYGIGFSAVGHVADAQLSSRSDEALAGLIDELKGRVGRDMFSEGFDAGGCVFDAWLTIGEREVAIDVDAPTLGDALHAADEIVVAVRASKAIARPVLPTLAPTTPSAATSYTTRRLLASDGSTTDMPVVHVEDQVPGAFGNGPLLLEEKYWTCHVPSGWAFRFSRNGDVFLQHAA